MCIRVGVDCILANVFANGRSKISLHDLHCIQVELNKIPEVLVGISEDCIYYAIDSHPDMFQWCDGSYICREQSQGNSDLFEPEYVDEYFNYNLPEAIKSEVVETLSRYCK